MIRLELRLLNYVLFLLCSTEQDALPLCLFSYDLSPGLLLFSVNRNKTMTSVKQSTPSKDCCLPMSPMENSLLHDFLLDSNFRTSHSHLLPQKVNR